MACEVWFLQEYFDILNWMENADYSFLILFATLTSQSSLAEENKSEILEISDWTPENKICKQGVYK